MFITHDQAAAFRAAAIDEYPVFVTFCRDVDRIANQIVTATRIGKSMDGGDYVGAIAVRMLTTYQGCVTLAEYGLEHEARVLLRTLLEAMFRICAVSLDRARAKTAIEDAELTRLESWRHIEATRALHSEMFQDAPPPPDLDELLALSKRRKNRKISVRQWATWAGVPAYYHTVYALFCDSAHVGVKGLESQFIIDSQSQPVALEYGPNSKSLPTLLLTSSEVMLRGLRAFTEVLSPKDTQEVDSLLLKAMTLVVPGEN